MTSRDLSPTITGATPIEARERVRLALNAADNGNHAGEQAVAEMAAAGAMAEALRETRVDLALLRANVVRSAVIDHRWDGMGDEIQCWIERIDTALTSQASGEGE